MEDLVDQLYEKDDLVAYQALLELEKRSDLSNRLYPFLEQFLQMLSSDRSYVRVRGFRLICKQAKWDEQNKIASCLEEMFSLFSKEKPTALRQYLQALKELVQAKKYLAVRVKEKVLALDLTQYKETVRSLIEKDIDQLLKEMSI